MTASEAPEPISVLVTGATGYIGSHVTRLLLDRGHDIRALVRSREKLHEVFDDTTIDRLDVVVGDMLDPLRGSQGGRRVRPRRPHRRHGQGIGAGPTT